MEAYNTTIYPVFEADQVLSQKDLNHLVSHLEEQDRMTRRNLTGIGIVCGLELSFPTATTVKVDCGTAVTSLGFQINWKETLFTDYHNYELSENFLTPDYTKEPHLDPIFKHAALYRPIKNCVELLPQNSSVTDKTPIPSDFFINKAVILLLEVALIDQKNCVTTNCDDKGKRMEFNIRTLLVPINELTGEILTNYSVANYFNSLITPRYNVPYKNLNTSADVLKGFEKIYDTNFLTSFASSVNGMYQSFKPLLPDLTEFDVLENCKPKIDTTVNLYKSGSNIQYLWDWISDLVACYNEIAEFAQVHPSLCCVNEALFPFHVVLGTNAIDSANFRTPFFSSLHQKTQQKQQVAQLTLLFQRWVHILNNFKVDSNPKIKITPSLYGKDYLSDKSIPFYYDDILNLNKKWNPELTLKNQSDTILSYHAEVTNYTSKLHIQKPLLFDIEKYNFFRIEGHIGKNYKTALKELNLIRDSHSLPFKITALNAVSFLNKEIDISKFDGRWDDLETDYDLARKRLYNITEYVINWMDTKKVVLANETVMTQENITSFKNILNQIKNLLTNDLKGFLPNYKSFYEIFKQLNLIFLFHKFCIQLGGEAKFKTVVEDLIDRFDDINELFLEDPFTVIYEEAYLRWQKVYKDLFFSTFIKKHPGLEHKAGVTKGGTFVVVYVDNSIFKAVAPPLSHTVLLNDIKTYQGIFNFETSVKQQIESSIKFKDYKSQVVRPSTTAIDKCKAETDNIKANLLEIAQFNLNANYTPEMSGFIFENIKDLMQFEPSTVNQNPFQQVIIADFFLPYYCCGGEGSNTIEIKFEIEQPLSISLERLNYCFNDPEDYEITINGPTGGAFTGSGAIMVEPIGGNYYLRPSKLTAQSVDSFQLTYTVNGETSNTLEIQISLPQAITNWTAQRNAQNHNLYVFNNSNANDTREYEFDFGVANTELLTTNAPSVTHIFPFNEINQSFVVTIKQLGGICQNTQTITVTNPIGDFQDIDFNPTDFNT